MSVFLWLVALCAGAVMESSLAAGWPQRLGRRVVESGQALGERRRRRQVFRQWPQALLFLAGAVNAGATLDDALDHLAQEAPEPLRSQIRHHARDSALTIEARLRRVMNDPGLRFARAALMLYLQTGGRVARLLETTASVLQERVEAEARVQALTAQGRASAWIIALTPLMLLAAMSLLAPDLVAPLFHTALGRLVLVVAAGLVGTGLLLAQRLARVDE